MSSPSLPKIAIIGAGLAGLTAALRLCQKKYDVEVYEAKNCVGGRVQTVYVKNREGTYSLAEMGGQNITDGGKAYYIEKLTQELGLNIEEDTVKASMVSYEKGQYRDFNTLLTQLNWTQNDIKEKLKISAQNHTSIAGVLKDLFPTDSFLYQSLYTRLKAYEGIDPKDQSIYHNIDTLRCTLEGGLSTAHESIESNMHQLFLKRIQGGNAMLPLKIAEFLKEKIHLNKALTSVSYHKNKIKLEFNDHSLAYCDTLILAIPILPLKDIKFEEGIIPLSQFQAIHKVQYGENYKVFVPIKYNLHEYRSIITDKQVSFFSKDRKLLVMYFIAQDGMHFFEDEINILQQEYSSISVPQEKPFKIQEGNFIKYDGPITRIWSADPYIKGSYVGYNVALGESLDKKIKYKNIEVKEIFAPVRDRIFFIGEHTTLLDEIGTMEAAVESGERVARLFSGQ